MHTGRAFGGCFEQENENSRAKNPSEWPLYLKCVVKLSVSSAEELPAILYLAVPERLLRNAMGECYDLLTSYIKHVLIFCLLVYL